MAQAAVASRFDFSPDESPMRLLIVDDEHELLSSLQRLLLSRGICAHGVSSGQEAIDVVRKNSFDVILIDLWMPGKNGLETLEKIRELDPHVSVVTMTAMGTACTETACLRAGAHRMLTKPFSGDTLWEALVAAADATRTTRDQADDSAPRRGLILLADDHQPFREALARRLRNEGYRVDAVGTGAAAVAAWRKRRYDLALLDIHMPDGNGLETAEQIHVIDPGAAIAFMTGEATRREMGQSVRHAAGVCLSKPLDFSKIPETIGHLIEVGVRTRSRQMSYLQYEGLSTLRKGMEAAHRRFRRFRRSGGARMMLLVISVSVCLSLPVFISFDSWQKKTLADEMTDKAQRSLEEMYFEVRALLEKEKDDRATRKDSRYARRSEP